MNPGIESQSIYFEKLSQDGLEEMHAYSIDERLYEFFEFPAFKKISDTVVPCSAETELLLRKATKAGIINYNSGDDGFKINESKEIPIPQQKALDLVSTVFSKIPSTGIQKILNSAVFDSLNLIAVYPVEDESKLTNKDGTILPDTKLLPQDSTAKDLASLIHADIAKGFLHAIDCKTKQRISGDQKLKHGDVIKIVSTLSRG